MKLLSDDGVQQVYENATTEDFYQRLDLQRRYYNKVHIKEDDVYLELCVEDWKEKGLDWHVSLSFNKETKCLHIPYLHKTYRFKEIE